MPHQHNSGHDKMLAWVVGRCAEIQVFPFLTTTPCHTKCYDELPLATIVPRSGHMTARIMWLDAPLWLAKPPDHVVEAATPTQQVPTAHNYSLLGLNTFSCHKSWEQLHNRNDP